LGAVVVKVGTLHLLGPVPDETVDQAVAVVTGVLEAQVLLDKDMQAEDPPAPVVGAAVEAGAPEARALTVLQPQAV
tara:strand:- start:43 stop:270 length:228 start_codon:yes stop_codon:yes gene_type:complete